MKNIRCVMLLGIVSLFNDGFAGVIAPKFEKDFNDIIAKSKLAVVHFVNYDVLPVDEEHKAQADALDEQLDDLKEDFSDVSHDDDFAGIVFVGVDLRAIPDLADDYDIKDVSTIILFKDGKPFKRRGNIVKRTGFMTQDDLEDWIDDHFEDFKTSVQPQQQTRVVRYAQPVSRSYYYDDYPYRRRYREYPYGYGSGIGFGFGGRRGGYRRYGGYGPGFGFGFGGRRGGIGFGFGGW